MKRKLPILSLFTLLILAAAFYLGASETAAPVEASDDQGASTFFALFPDEIVYACVGKPIKMLFYVGVEEADLGPLASLNPPDIQVLADQPVLGTLSSREWRIRSNFKQQVFTYTPTKTGIEHLSIYVNNPKRVATQERVFPIIYCKYKISIHSEIQNQQAAKGAITSNIFYDGEGHLDISKEKGSSKYTLRGYGTTTFEAYSDGTEGGMTCVTTSPGKASGTFYVDGEGDPTEYLLPTFHFDDVGAAVGIFCSNKKGSQPGTIPRLAWLPNAAQSGVIKGLRFKVAGDNKDLGIGEFNDLRWLQGSNSGDMLITITPEMSK